MSNREWLKQLVASETKKTLSLDGTHRLETGHTIYVFEDAVCVDVARRGEDDVSADLTLVGMRLVGWLLEVEGHRRVLERWLPGARAILWHAGRIALTSASFALTHCSFEEDDDDDFDTAEYAPLRAASSGSFARLFHQE
jgi:hypothetical protein